ncbi:MAG: ABC transporter permease subunit [Gammaproteobacteria bacterium]|nr:ABC transporter permease subunit [Gammaproteobacteria bacterium]
MIGLLARQEFSNAIRSPLAWVLFAALQLIFAFIFFSLLEVFRQTSPQLVAAGLMHGVTEPVVAGSFTLLTFVLLLVVPLLTMRVLAEERRDRTLVLLLSAPVTPLDIVLGKFLGIMGVIAIPLALAALMPLMLLAGGSLDFGLYLCALAGLLLAAMFFCAVGVCISAMTASPALAAVATAFVLLLSWLANWRTMENAGDSTLELLSWARQLEPFWQGLFSTAACAWFIITSLLALALAAWWLNGGRGAMR